MRFKYTLVPVWPPLAWLVRCHNSSSRIEVFLGSHVETTDEWFCEAAWAGDYESGGFDQTDIVAGSGGHLRDGKIVFVSSGSTVDRLHSLHVEDGVWVSNSLSCLLASVGAVLDISYPKYHQDFGSIIQGIREYRRILATSAGPVLLTYFDNLIWDGHALTARSKPGGYLDFSTFARYFDFLDSSMQLLAENIASSGRRHSYTMLSTLSSGYDSPTVTALARRAGCAEAFSFDRARGGDDDSGAAIAAIFGVRCLAVRRDAWRSMALPEVPFIAAGTGGGDVLFKGAENYLARRVLLSGFHGDKMWAKDTTDLSENIVRGDDSGLGLTEYRLWADFIHCAVPFWGVRQIRDVNAIGNSPEMAPWDVPGWYSRPICRRIVEEAGVPRDLFAIRKGALSVLLYRPNDFLTPHSREDYLDWYKRHWRDWLSRGRIPPVPRVSGWVDWGLQSTVNLAERVSQALPHTRGLWRLSSISRPGLAWVSNQLTQPVYLRRYTYPWAIEHARQRYPRPF